MTLDQAFFQFPELHTNHLLPRHYGQEPHHSIDQTQGWIARLISGFTNRESLFWAVTLKGDKRVIGGVTFWNFGEGIHCVELGYELHPDFWGKGLASKACAAVLDFGFTVMELNRVEACPLAANPDSSRLLVKLGFAFEGDLRQRITFRGQHLDQLYYGLLREEWSKPA
jgi:ribosomal-protein-alanine N-acetyltransferase